MTPPDILDAITPVVEALEQLGVTYHIGGSAALGLNNRQRPRLHLPIGEPTPFKREDVQGHVGYHAARPGDAQAGAEIPLRGRPHPGEGLYRLAVPGGADRL